MAPEEDDRYGVDMRDSPPPRTRSHNDDHPIEGRTVPEAGDRHREVTIASQELMKSESIQLCQAFDDHCTMIVTCINNIRLDLLFCGSATLCCISLGLPVFHIIDAEVVLHRC